MELRGLPSYIGIPPFCRCVVTLGTSSGTLRGFFLSLSFGLALTALAVRSLRLSYPPCFFYAGGGGAPALRRAFPVGAGHRAKRWPVAFLFHVFFTFSFSFFDFLHFGHIHVFCEEGVKMCFFLFWLFSAVFLCGQFQYDVKNRWNSNVFVFSTVFVWTIPVCVILTKGNSVTFACELP